MPFHVNITLSDEELQGFQKIVDDGKKAMAESGNAEAVAAAAGELIEKVKEMELSGFISERFAKLDVLLQMINDKEWQLDDDEHNAICAALYYFVDPKDAVPDDVPGFGYLDDALYAEIVIRELKNEMQAYTEFCIYRTAEEARRRREGLDPYVGREHWLAAKRAVLHNRMRERRSRRASGGGWSVSLF